MGQSCWGEMVADATDARGQSPGAARHGLTRSKRMRVLYTFPHRIGYHGIGTTAAAQVKGLAARGVEVTVYCASAGCDLPGVQEVVETMVVGGRRVPPRVMGVDRAYRYHDWRTARALERRAESFDVVHCWPASCQRTLAVGRRLGVRTFREVVSAHTATAYESAGRESALLRVELPKGHSHRFDPKRLAIEEIEFRLADVLLVPSSYVERTFLERGFDPARLARHQYGFDPERFAPAVRHEPFPRPFTVLFAGRGEPNKGLHYALQAWHDSGASADGRFLICGAILPRYRKLLAPLLEHPSIEELGFVDDVEAVMRTVDVLVLPSVTEGSALVTYEAQGCGCVLLVSDATGAQVTHLEQALVHPVGDVRVLTEHLRMLHGDGRLLARLKAATIRGRDQLTWDRAADRLLRVYESRLAAV